MNKETLEKANQIHLAIRDKRTLLDKLDNPKNHIKIILDTGSYMIANILNDVSLTKLQKEQLKATVSSYVRTYLINDINRLEKELEEL